MPRKAVTVFIVVIAALLVLGSCIAPNSSKDGEGYINDTIVPPIDRTVSAVVKTATFSAG
jgi:hypothetical protein